MFEDLIERAQRAAALRAGARGRDLGERLAAELPADVRCEAVREGVAISGRELRLRFMLEPALRWMVARAR